MLDIQKIDTYLNKLAFVKSDAELRALFSSFQAPFCLDVHPDPFSAEYREEQFAIYESLAGKSYKTSNEKTPFDVTAASIKPFPYMHESCELVGNQLMAIGFLIKALNLSRGSKVLEFGPGWGNTTLVLSKMGFNVTAIDIEENFVNLIKKRSEMEGLHVNVIKGDFSMIETIADVYDAVLYFECFHHASDHLRLIAAFDKVVAKGGIVCFAAEPISSDFPIPWGLRMDGESIWAIRKMGWLELGFNDQYFRKALGKFGWRGLTIRGRDSPWSSLITAKRLCDWGGVFVYGENGLKHTVGEVSNVGCKSNGKAGYLAFGPYINLPAGRYTVQISLDMSTTFLGEFTLDIVASDMAQAIAVKKVEAVGRGQSNLPVIEFEILKDAWNLEVRVLCDEKTNLCIQSIEILAV